MGKILPAGGKTLLPVTAQCHHALVDGIHLARFYEALEQELQKRV